VRQRDDSNWHDFCFSLRYDQCAISHVGKTTEEFDMDYLKWVHEISQSALAAAVLTLAVVILLELQSIARLRRSVDSSLQRVFEQLDLLRFESQQAQEPAPSLPSSRTPSAEATVGLRRPPAALAPTLPAAQIAGSLPSLRAAEVGSGGELSGGRGFAAGEARLLASLAAARAKRGRAVGQAV
jgi:hypothetical protein